MHIWLDLNTEVNLFLKIILCNFSVFFSDILFRFPRKLRQQKFKFKILILVQNKSEKNEKRAVFCFCFVLKCILWRHEN